MKIAPKASVAWSNGLVHTRDFPTEQCGPAFSCRLMVVLLLAVASRCAADDWPTWQHDNRRTGTTADEIPVDVLGLRWTWQSPSPPQTAWAGPAKWDAYAHIRGLPSMRSYDAAFHVAAVGDHIWFGSSVDDSLYCLSAADGERRWRFTTDGPVRLAPTWSEGRIYFGSDDGHARCADAGTGELIWKFTPADTSHRLINNGRLIPFQPCRTGVMVEDGTAWFACALLPWKDAWLCAVDSANGSTEADQHYVTSLPGRTMEGPPALSSKFLVLPQGRVAPRVFDRGTGKDLGEMVKSGGGSVVVVTLQDNIVHGPATDSRRGGFRESDTTTREVVAGLGKGNALVADGDTSYMLTDSEIIASSLTMRTVVWRANCDCPYTMIKAGSVLFAGGEDQVAAFSADSGRQLWQHAAHGRVYGLAAANGRLFASTDTGAIHCFAAGNPAGDSDSLAAQRVQSELTIADVEPVEDDRLLSRWVFQRNSINGLTVRALNGKDNITLSEAPALVNLAAHDGAGGTEGASPNRNQVHQAMEFDGGSQTVMIAPEYRSAATPARAFSAEAWVRIDQPQEWGGIIGAVQDNGDDEHGWILGFRKQRFSIGLATKQGPGRMTYLTAPEDFALFEWHHVAATYDGAALQLFVDGKLVAESGEQSGDIDYPPNAFYEVAAYHDSDEYFRMIGALHEVRVYNAAVSPAEIASRFENTRDWFPLPVETARLASGPWLAFDGPGSAVIRWETDRPVPSHLEFGTHQLERVETDAAPTTAHAVTVSGLKHNRIYRYRIGTASESGPQFTAEYECDAFFNFSPPAIVAAHETHETSVETATADWIIRTASVSQGMALLFGAKHAELALELARRTSLRIVVVETDAETVRQAREDLHAAGAYGSRVTVHLVDDPASLPFTTGWANLVLAPEAVSADTAAEAHRSRRPDGGVFLQPAHSESGSATDADVVTGPSGHAWHRHIRAPLPGATDWSHLYGNPDNAAFVGETLGGAKSTDELEVQWVGRPGPRYQADRSGRKPSPLSTAGRLFLQGLHRIIAVDAYNGTVLWSVEIPDLERFNMPRDCSNWCADRDHLYVAVRDECWKIDAATGEVTDRIATTQPNDSSFAMDWGFVANSNGRLYGSSVRAGSSWTGYWGDAESGWYDSRSGPVTFPVCSDMLFCKDATSGELQWEYRRGIVLNSTITVADDRMYFVESRDPASLETAERRIGKPSLWNNLHLVAIDAASGTPLWEKQLDPHSQKVVMYLAHAADQLTLVTSADARFQVTSFADENGEKRWTQQVKWPEDKGDHGKAMSRPAIVGDELIVRPNVLSLATGDILSRTMPTGHGCGTYACTADAVFLRSDAVTMWNRTTSESSDWPRLRPDCWLSTIPAGGMLLSPEGGGGCSCGSWMETSMGFIPKSADRNGSKP